MISTTDAAGSTITSTVATTVVVTPSIDPNAASSGGSHTSSSHTGAIVGGVVGGIGGAILLAVIAWLLLRKRRRDEFDGDFDPDKVVGGRRGGGVDLVGGEAGNVEPYNYVPPGVGAGAQMSEAGGSSLLGAGAAGLGAGAGLAAAGAGAKRSPPTSAPSAYSQGQSAGSQSHYAPSTSDPGYDYAAYAAYSDPHSGSASGHGYESTSPRSSAFPGGFHPGYGPGGAEGLYRGGPSPGPSLPPSGSATGSSSAGMTIPSTKEMEARGLRVANAPAGEGSGVVQHQDAGRLPETPEGEDTPPNEIPPSYDSIRRD